MPRLLLLTSLCAAVCALGCASTLKPFRRPSSPPVCDSTPTYQVVEDASSDLEFQIHRIQRGSRGCLIFATIHNRRSIGAMEIDWSKLKVRLGSGLIRNPMTFRGYQLMREQHGGPAYGEEGDSDLLTRLECAFPHVRKASESLILIPASSSLPVVLAIGCPPAENGLLVVMNDGFDASRRSKPPNGGWKPYQIAVKLPPIEAEPTWPDWWPDWLHFNFTFSNAM